MNDKIDRNILESIFGKDVVLEVINAYSWTDENFEEKFKDQVWEWVLSKEKDYQAEIDTYNFHVNQHMGSTQTMIQHKIKEKVGILNDIERIKNDFENEIPIGIQKQCFVFLTIPIKSIDTFSLKKLIGF
jgi:hypothetical protein